MIGGYCFDIFACITRKKLAVSSVRVKKFCATTEFDAAKIHSSVFKAPYSLGEGLARTLEFEFIYPLQMILLLKVNKMIRIWKK